MEGTSPPHRTRSFGLPGVLRRKSTRSAETQSIASDQAERTSISDSITRDRSFQGSSRRKSSIGSIGTSVRSLVKGRTRHDSIAEVETSEYELGTEAKHFSRLFFGLPVEIQTHIISVLDFQDLLRVRRSCKALKALVDISEKDIVRYHVENYLDAYILQLYPPGDLRKTDLNYLSGVYHRRIVCTKLAKHLTAHVRAELYRQREDKDEIFWEPRYHKLRSRLTDPLLTIFNFFESVQSIHVTSWDEDGRWIPSKYRPSETTPITYTERIYAEDTMPKSKLLETLYTYQLLSYALQYRWRSRSYAGSLERTLRGWIRDPPSTADYMALLYVGGLDSIERTWRPGTAFAIRRQSLDVEIKRVRRVNTLKPGVPDGRDAKSLVGPSSPNGTQFRRPMHGISSAQKMCMFRGLDQELADVFEPAARAALLKAGIVKNEDEIRNYTFWLSEILGDGDVGNAHADTGSEQDSEEEEEEEDVEENQSLAGGFQNPDQAPNPAHDSPVWTSVI